MQLSPYAPFCHVPSAHDFYVFHLRANTPRVELVYCLQPNQSWTAHKPIMIRLWGTYCYERVIQ